MNKKSKSEVDYSVGMAKSHCGKVFKDDKGYCAHFRGSPASFTSDGVCEVVTGTINRVYWCKLYRAR